MIQFVEKSRLARNVAGTLLRVLGQGLISQEKDPVFLRAHFEGTISRLVQKQRKTRFGSAHDFARVRSSADYQRLVPTRNESQLEDFHDFLHGNTSDPLNQKFPTATFAPDKLTRQDALNHILKFLAGRFSWNLLYSQWVIASDIYDPRFSWADFPPWFKFFSRSPGEKVREDWSGIWTTWANLQSDALFHLVEQRKKSTASRPAVMVVECHAENLPEALAYRQKMLPLFQVIPVWSQRPGPVAFLDPETSQFQFVLAKQLLIEFAPLHGPNKERLALCDFLPEQDYAVILTAPGGLWACETSMTARTSGQTHRFHLLPLSMRHSKIKLPKPLSFTTAPTPFPHHPRTADTPAKLAETRRHTVS
ncbi:MAG: hypothetical protein EXR99_02795 [Gemmataceae bacterium]|nr:hypothetical protein [Gemmataceae bacterium]